VIQEIGGWSSIDIVMNRYGHLFDTLQDDLAARQEEAYRAGGAWDDLLDIVARREIPMNPSPSDQVFVSADCLHETEAEARTCCPEPVTKRRGWDEWAELEVVASTERNDDLYGPFLDVWGLISDDNTGAMFDPARQN
jgi:hypothetical protein